MNRLLNNRLLIFAGLMLLLANAAVGQTADQAAYCEFVMQQAMAQRNLLRTPEAVGGITQPNTGTPSQLYWGISDSLANYSKANLTMEAARKNCESYRASTGAAAQIQSALPRLEGEALRHRRQLLEQAIEQLDGIINRTLRIVEVQNLTRPVLYSVQSIRARLVADRISTELRLALLDVPDISSDVPLKQLVFEKEARESEAQKSLAAVTRQNWDVRMEAGGRQRLSPFLQNSVQPYGGVVFNYNFGSSSNSSHLEQAAAAYTAWKRVQHGEVAHDAQVLEHQIMQSILVEQAQLMVLQQQEIAIDDNLQRLVGVDSASATGFGNQLDSDKVVLQVEIKDVTFRLQALQEYLKNNF